MREGMNHPHKLRELTGNAHYRYECVGCGRRFHRKPQRLHVELAERGGLELRFEANERQSAKESREIHGELVNVNRPAYDSR